MKPKSKPTTLLADRKQRRLKAARKLIADGEADRYTADDSISHLPEEQLHNESFGLNMKMLVEDVIDTDDAEVIAQTQHDVLRFGFGVVNSLARLCDCVVADDSDMVDLKMLVRVLTDVISCQAANRKKKAAIKARKTRRVK